MGWLGESEYNCPECDGETEVECLECGVEGECLNCKGTGWDPDQVDIDGFKAAENALEEKAGGTYEWIDPETDTRLGRRSKEETVAVADFLK